MSSLKINEQIAFLRKQKGVTQEELAQALGVTNQSVSKWEAASCCPDNERKINKLAPTKCSFKKSYRQRDETG